MGVVWKVDTVAHRHIPRSFILMKELRPGWVWEMGVLNIADQVRWKRMLRVYAVAQSICWARPALVRSILRLIRRTNCVYFYVIGGACLFKGMTES